MYIFMAYGLCRRPLGQAVNRWSEGLRGFANCSLPGAPSQEHSWPSIDLSFQSVEFSCKLSHKSDRLKVWESTVALKLQKGCQPLGTRNVVCLTPLQKKLQFSSQDEKYVGWTLWRWGGANLRISFLWGTCARESRKKSIFHVFSKCYKTYIYTCAYAYTYTYI